MTYTLGITPVVSGEPGTVVARGDSGNRVSNSESLATHSTRCTGMHGIVPNGTMLGASGRAG